MSRETEPDGSEDVNDFLVRIRELGNKRDKEDEERARKLEEEILQGRRERQARRAERARSISPTKDSPPLAIAALAGAPALTPSTSSQSIEPPIDLRPSPKTVDPDAGGELERADTVKAKGPAPSDVKTSDLALPSARSRALSWKQRPISRDFDVSGRSSPSLLSAGQPPATESTQTEDQSLSRDQIAQSLGSKDPSWFRQTADRGTASPAYRRGLEESVSDLSGMSSGMKLPGLSGESTTEPQKPASTDHASERSRSPSRASSAYGTNSVGNRYSSISSVSTTGALGSPMPLSSAQRFHAKTPSTTNESQHSERLAMSPSQGRLASDRPSSPTKGLGGFVQSAMLKRSDSVSKRWSAQSNTGRGNMSPIGRAEFGTPRFSHQSNPSQGAARESPGASNSRPSSSHSEATVVRHQLDREDFSRSVGSRSEMGGNDGFVKPALPSQSHGASDSLSSAGEKSPDIPTTPSKTMDPKRWSPTKASWLESALSKPESPRPKAQNTQEPEWKRDLAKLRQNRASVDLGKASGIPSSTTSPTRSRTASIIQPLQESEERGLKTGAEVEPPKHETASSESRQPPPKPHKNDGLNQEHSSPPTDNTDNVSSPILTSAGSLPRSKMIDDITSKPKPQSPPVNDFRANLRRRGTTNETSSTGQPEFMNVFGKLRRAETKNYVAPDELKGNILKGKAALNATGGPKKTQRVDEFKESILKRKEAMKAGGGSIRQVATNESTATSSPPLVPEAIALRSRLGRSGSIQSGISIADLSKPSPKLSPDKLPRLSPMSPPPESYQADGKDLGRTELEEPQEFSPVKGPGTSSDGTEKSSSSHLQGELADNRGKIDANSQPRKVLPDVRAKPVVKIPAEALASDPSPIKASPVGELVGKGSLANRLNPALAGILSRGPPAPSSAPSSSPSDVSSSRKESTEPSAPATLTHVTKSRARGPKRRLPQAAKGGPTLADDKVEDVSKSTPVMGSRSLSRPSVNDVPLSATPTSRPPISRKSSEVSTKSQISDSPTTSWDVRKSVLKPSISTKSPELRKFTPTADLPARGDPSEAESKIELPILPSTRYGDSEPSLAKPAISRTISSESSVPLTKPTPQKSASFPFPQQRRSISPHIPPKPKALDETSAPSPTEDTQPEETMESEPKQIHFQKPRNLPSTPAEQSKSPAPPRKPSSAITGRSSESISTVKSSPFPETSEARQIFSDFFGALPAASQKITIDPQPVLMSRRGNSPKVKTLAKQIWELTSDGKKHDLPANQEYILFEESMYLCVHVFELNGSKTAEVDLWCGDGVSEAAVEDVQLFARKVARENGGRLELLKQGKETASFIQALGGIIITRRGSSSRFHSSALYMLCGRRHMGQIAFDEVDLSAKKLCSGFPHIVSAKFGKLYLWKGRGSTADELGCARLIGMDLGLTGEIEEVAEGAEPAGFFEAFPDANERLISPSADYWGFKPTNDKYCCRLFRVDHELGQRFGSGFWNRRGLSSPVRSSDVIQEIDPFCQRDLDPSHVYVLDAFFEIYLIVGEHAKSRSAEFASALVFAQEYGILAVSEQDRPFLPKGYVVLNASLSFPTEGRRAFRKWDERAGSPAHPGGNVAHNVIPLNAAIETIR
ncbi:hypothetical protein AJ80_00090 [Polytolypa hystricis UAMH7299]|uniref:DUF4045 domain-containing protein n=1 Tax=Polytolypa hystricis (strain UAMH7299) TaxID=1447883 RepID=A0A2B7Z465_POLH7|nr:hypothetical protein AJ80_00090 [Polytolypa hystricis UAMH7299]